MSQKYEETVEFDAKMMRRCLFLASRAKGNVSPNPMVGAVVVYRGKIIGEGFHRRYGGPHAEVHAIESVKNKQLLSDSTLYVSLEPCSHWGKTPPCADLIIENKIPRVVIAAVDPFGKVCGNGIRKLKEAGIDVTVGTLEKEAIFINRRFFCFHQNKRPYIILKWAETSDGFIDEIRAPENITSPKWITNDAAKVLVHRWRSEEDAILIGGKTALMDNPQLSIRYYAGTNPLRIVIDSQGNLPETLNIFSSEQPTLLFTSFPQKYEHLWVSVAEFDKTADLHQILSKLQSMNVQSIIVEGGTKTLQRFLDQNLYDEIRRFIGEVSFGNGIKAPIINSQIPQKIDKIGNCRLLTYYNSEFYVPVLTQFPGNTFF